MKNFFFLFALLLIAVAVDGKPRKPKKVQEPLPVIVQSKPNLTGYSEGHYILAKKLLTKN